MAAGHILKKTMAGRSVYDLALERIRHAYDIFDHIAVSFSGGKDSTVVLNLAAQVAAERGRLPLDVFHWDEEAIQPETVDYVDRVRQRPDVALRWFCLPVTHRNACSMTSPFWWPWDPEQRDRWVRPLPPHGITQLAGFARQKIPDANSVVFPPDGRTVGLLMGIRADESLMRYRGVSTRRVDNYIIQDHAARWCSLVKPIYDWRTVDVWTAPHRLGWDYNRAYDLMALAGISPHQQRVAPPYGEQPMKGLWMYQQCWPDLWDGMVQRVPGAATALRYAHTDLYGAGGLKTGLRPPAGMTWPQAVRYYVDRHPESVRAWVAKRLQSWMRRHRRLTTRPIPETEADPRSGVSWALLLYVAMRGDLKTRVDPSDFVQKEDQTDDDDGTRY